MVCVHSCTRNPVICRAELYHSLVHLRMICKQTWGLLLWHVILPVEMHSETRETCWDINHSNLTEQCVKPIQWLSQDAYILVAKTSVHLSPVEHQLSEDGIHHARRFCCVYKQAGICSTLVRSQRYIILHSLQKYSKQIDDVFLLLTSLLFQPNTPWNHGHTVALLP